MGILEDLRWIDIPSDNLYIISGIIDFSRPSDHWYEEFQKNKSITRSTKYINNLKQLISQGTKIILDCTMEGSLIKDDIREYLGILTNHKVDFNSIFLAFNNSYLSSINTTTYSGYNVKCVYFPHFFISTLFEFEKHIKPVITNSPSYDFLCLNRRMRIGKYKLLKELKERNLLEKTLYTYVKTLIESDVDGTVSKNQLKGDKEYGEHISDDDEHFLYWLNTDWYSNIKVDIVNETYYLEDDQCHLTEKIFKPMMLEKPFVVNSTKGYLKELKRLGFKTFSEVIDESYDDANNDIRYKLVVDAAKELASIYNTNKVKQICKHNKNLFFSISHKKDIVKKLFISQLKTDGLLPPKLI